MILETYDKLKEELSQIIPEEEVVIAVISIFEKYSKEERKKLLVTLEGNIGNLFARLK